VWTFETYRETLTPAFNLPVQVPTALSEDLTSLVPVSATPGERPRCDRFGELAARLRGASVTHVVSLDPLSDAALQPLSSVWPPDIAPLGVHLYRVTEPLPRFSVMGTVAPRVPGRALLFHEGATSLELSVEAAASSVLVIRDGTAPGWQAWVNGAPAVLAAVDGGRHREVRVEDGTSRVRLSYRPPGLTAALVVTALSIALAAALGWRGLRREAPPAVSPPPASAAGSGAIPGAGA
jgi:hypothetical protein